MSENGVSTASADTGKRKRPLVANGQNGDHVFKKPRNPRMEVDQVAGINGTVARKPAEVCQAEPTPSTPSHFAKPSGNVTNGLTHQSSRSISGVPTGGKRLIIKNFRQRSSASKCDNQSQWKMLEDSVLKIQEKQTANVSLEELYEMVESLCQNNYESKLYEGIQQIVERYVSNEAKRMQESNQDANEAKFLQSLNTLWLEYCDQMVMIRSIFLFLDRTYVLQNPSILSLWDAGLEIFRVAVMDCSRTRKRTLNALLNVIEAERMGTHADRQLLKSLLRMFGNLRLYDVVFEPAFIKATEKLYRDESRMKCQELDVASYLMHVDRRLSEEEERVDYYLDFSTRKRLIEVTERCFIADYVDTFVQKGTDSLLNDNKKPELALMYSLLSRVKEGHAVLKNHFSAYVKKVGKTMVMDTERDKNLVQDLLDFKAKLDGVVKNCFLGNPKIAQTQKDAFDYFINTRPNKPAELVAKFMDIKLRSGNKDCTEEELDHVMDDVILLFRFIQGKDVFEAFYKKDLAKRLLLGRSASVDSEKAMLSKLKNECGAGFTQKLEGMFKDMEISKELCNTFKQYLDGSSERSSHLHKTEFTVNVLTMGHWPNYPIMEVSIPPLLCEFQQVFAKFYTSKHNGRKLQWQYSLASAILKGTFKPKVQKELDVSLFQAMVLLMFNDKTEWCYDEIKECTKIEEQELKRTLQSLACGKFRVITKEPRGKDISSSDKFTFNEDFNDRLYRIRISTVQMRETEAEHRQTEEQVFQDRQYQIDAAVVRIMKMRKKLAHNLLISELFNQLRFPVKQVDLKKRIESLIEREYMNRDKDDPQLYHYVT